MIYLPLFINLIAILVLIRKFNFTSPIVIFCFFNLLLLTVYFLAINDSQMTDIFQSGTALPVHQAGLNSIETSNLFSVFGILCIFLSFLSKKQKKKIFKEKINPNYLNLKINSDIYKLFSVIFFLTAVFHAADLNWDTYWSYKGYLSVKDYQFSGLDFKISQTFDRAKRFIAIICLFCFFYSEKSFNIYRSIYLITFIYILVLIVAEVSRFLPLITLMIPLCKFLIKKKISFLELIIWGILAAFFYILVIEARLLTNFGLSNFWSHISHTTDTDFNSTLLKILGNAFQGALNFDVSQNINTYYPTKHKFLSFFPTLSVIDGWNVYWVKDNMINRFVPINSFAEAYKFGFFYLLFYQFIFVLMLYFSSIDLSKNNLNLNFFLLTKIISYFLIFFTSQYTLRPCMRLILLNFLILIFLVYFEKKQNKSII